MLSITNNGKQTLFEYDGWGNLAKATYPDGKVELRNPDKTGNLFATVDRIDRKYGAGGRLEQSADYTYKYDDEGHLTEKRHRVQVQQAWKYHWNSAGMLEEVVRPDGSTVSFKYDALGRRIEKRLFNRKTRWIWDGNVPLHEWEYKAKDLQVAQDQQPPVEPTEDVTTWVFEAGTFVPAAKLKGDERYSIVTDYLGTPIQMYDEQGEKTWDCTLDVYGKVATFEGSSLRECPFRYQGQYEDEETGLYYNRFRYYEPEVGSYINQDLIGLNGGMALYDYVNDPNSLIDILGLTPWGDMDISFGEWFDKHSTPASIQANKSSVECALRGMNGGSNHEMFPVSIADKAKELGFTYDELKNMTIKTADIEFVNIVNKKGVPIPDGTHHCSSAGRHFHNKLIEELKLAKSKDEALAIIKKKHDNHMVLKHH